MQLSQRIKHSVGLNDQRGPAFGVGFTAAFLGHSIDYTIKVGELLIRAETSPDVTIPAGQSTQMQIPRHHSFVYRFRDES